MQRAKFELEKSSLYDRLEAAVGAAHWEEARKLVRLFDENEAGQYRDVPKFVMALRSFDQIEGLSNQLGRLKDNEVGAKEDLLARLVQLDPENETYASALKDVREYRKEVAQRSRLRQLREGKLSDEASLERPEQAIVEEDSQKALPVGKLIRRAVDGEEFVGKVLLLSGTALNETEDGLVNIGTSKTYASGNYADFVSVWGVNENVQAGQIVRFRVRVEECSAVKVGTRTFVVINAVVDGAP